MLWWEAIGNKVYADEPLYSALHVLNRETVYARGAFQTTVPSLGWEGNAMRPARGSVFQLKRKPRRFHPRGAFPRDLIV
jgi:hypothetical protein